MLVGAGPLPYTAGVEGERTVSSRRIYTGRLLKLRVDQVELRDGRLTSREIVEHPGAVGIVAFSGPEELVLVRQYRKAAERSTLEIPAGTLGPGEDPAACASRELREETGCSAAEWQPLCSFYSAVGFCTELMHLFVARRLSAGEQACEDDESIEVVRTPVPRAMEMVREGAIVDAKTVAGVFWAELLLKGDNLAAALPTGGVR